MRAFLTIMLLMTAEILQAQPPAEQLANRIAQKMKDTLSLTDSQKSRLYDINMQLHSQKMAARKPSAQSDLLRAAFQKIENTRDSLYYIVLADDKFILYKQKKSRLVNNN